MAGSMRSLVGGRQLEGGWRRLVHPVLNACVLPDSLKQRLVPCMLHQANSTTTMAKSTCFRAVGVGGMVGYCHHAVAG
jgi:hypothetical protein